MSSAPVRRKITALPITQWLSSWDKVDFNPKAMQSKPDPTFYLFSMKASELKKLTGVYRRSTSDRQPRAKDPNVQREHDEDRSDVIRDFVHYGYPWCEMSKTKRESLDFRDLQKPGWLPTAIVVNILPKGEVRNGKTIAATDQILVNAGHGSVDLLMPEGYEEDAAWKPETVFPLEVIDGQHRLWAFDDTDLKGDFELPVVAYHGLDRSWQAYLFWSINITPKRIKQSLAFDLYPLLRTEDWLERFQGHSIYRETRAQELVESLWAHPLSPWFERINMLGEAGKAPMVSQAAWIRSLMATCVRSWDGKGKNSLGGLFGAPLRQDRLVLPWSRATQAAFLIFSGSIVREEIEKHKQGWAHSLRQVPGWNSHQFGDTAFYGPHTLLSTDQGIRGLLFAINDVVYCASEDLKLVELEREQKAAATDHQAVSAAIKFFEASPLAPFIRSLAKGLSTYNWRTSSAPGLTEVERKNQLLFKGSGGYSELRRQLIDHLSTVSGPVGAAAKAAGKALGYSA